MAVADAFARRHESERRFAMARAVVRDAKRHRRLYGPTSEMAADEVRAHRRRSLGW